MYLWYLPVLVVMTAGRIHLEASPSSPHGSAVIVVIAAASFRLLETPIRRGALAGWRSWVAVPLAAVTVSLVPLLVPTLSAMVPAAALAAAAAALAGSTAALPFGRSVRILLVGDSMAGSLGVGMSMVAPHFDAQVVNEGSPGCSVAEAGMVRVLWYTVPPGQPCQTKDPQHVFAAYRSLVQKFDPDVVVYLARADTLDTQLHGSWQHVGQRSFDQWAESRFDQAISVLGSGGAHVVLLTSPFYDSGEQGNGQPWPENTPARVTEDNALLKQAARRAPSSTSVIDLGALVSPAGQFATQVGGVTLRCTDGVHFTIPGGQWVGEHLMPELVSLGRARALAPPQAHRPPWPMQAEPGWYSSLPCGS